MPRTAHVAGAVLKYFMDRPDQDIHLDHIVQTTGLARQQIMTAISTARTRHGTPIRGVISGQVYRYDSADVSPAQAARRAARAAAPSGPETPEPGTLMEVIGRPLSDGGIVLQDGDAGLWRAVKL